MCGTHSRCSLAITFRFSGSRVSCGNVCVMYNPQSFLRRSLLVVAKPWFSMTWHVFSFFPPLNLFRSFRFYAYSGASREFRNRHGPTCPFATMDAIEWRFKLKEVWVIDTSTGNHFYPPETVRMKNKKPIRDRIQKYTEPIIAHRMGGSQT